MFLVITGCGSRPTVSENQCIAGDWQTLGYRDGSAGYRSTTLLAHQDACGEHGIVPDRAGYMIGWEQGVREFCEPNNGFVVGERGQSHNNVCPDDLRGPFLSAYQQGRSLYLARAEVANLERSLAQRQTRLEQVKGEIVSAAAAQFSGTLMPAERMELLARLQRLHEEQQALEVEIVDLELERDRKARDLDHLSQSLAAVTF
jgi:hypothetical protein